MAEIRTLSHREQCREKLPVYFGSNDNFYHPVRESVVNARDILKDLDSGIIEVILHDDCETITIKDNGTGLPMDGETNGVPNYELLLLTLFAGTKMNNGGTDGGTNGCGNTVTNFTSSYFKAVAKRNNKEYLIEFENGGQIKTPFTIVGDTNKHGTEITFRLDKDVYTNTIFDPNVIEGICEKICATSSNITSRFIHKDIVKEFNYNSLDDYLNTYLKEPQIKNINLPFKRFETKNKNEIEKTDIEIVLNIDNEKTTQDSFLNGIYLPEKGTIHDGILIGLRNSINKFAKENALYTKKEKQIGIKDIEEVISYAALVESTHVSYENQVKFKTKKELYRSLTQSYIEDYFEIFKIENRDVMTFITNKVIISKRANEKAENSIKDIKKALESKIINSPQERPSKFVPCRSKNKDEIQFIVIEGDSALNPIKLARNPLFQCIMPLKGKPINVLKNPLDKVLKNQEFTDIYKIMGCGLEYQGKQIKGLPKFDINNLNIKELLIGTDLDLDGLHIQCLMLAMLFTFSPELIAQGKVKILYTPLYVFKCNKEVSWENQLSKTILIYSEDEKNKFAEYLKDNNVKFKDTRYKGIGGLPTSIMSKALNPETMVAKKITMKDCFKAKEILDLFMSDETLEDRKDFIQKYGKEYFDFSIFE